MQTVQMIIVILIVGACVVHLYRVLRELFRGESSGCGCREGGCGGPSKGVGVEDKQQNSS